VLILITAIESLTDLSFEDFACIIAFLHITDLRLLGKLFFRGGDLFNVSVIDTPRENMETLLTRSDFFITPALE
jgi:hypothetical protein